MRASRVVVALLVLAAAIGWAVWSYLDDGVVRTLFAGPEAGETTLDGIRRHVLAWGPLAPAAYVAIVMVEVLVAPIPGAILYAPGGAIFGGLIGGTLSLIGNVAGAAIACWLAAAFGEGWLARRADGTRLAVLRDRLRTRGGWIVFVLRVNPFTSSDLVSYAAGLAGVAPRAVALGTLFGMAPQCYVQAYLAASLFEILPGSPAVLLAVGLVIAVVIVVLVLGRPVAREAGQREA